MTKYNTGSEPTPDNPLNLQRHSNRKNTEGNNLRFQSFYILKDELRHVTRMCCFSLVAGDSIQQNCPCKMHHQALSSVGSSPKNVSRRHHWNFRDIRILQQCMQNLTTAVSDTPNSSSAARHHFSCPLPKKNIKCVLRGTDDRGPN